MGGPTPQSSEDCATTPRNDRGPVGWSRKTVTVSLHVRNAHSCLCVVCSAVTSRRSDFTAQIAKHSESPLNLLFVNLKDLAGATKGHNQQAQGLGSQRGGEISEDKILKGSDSPLLVEAMPGCGGRDFSPQFWS